jgi:hypothetical protein
VSSEIEAAHTIIGKERSLWGAELDPRESKHTIYFYSRVYCSDCPKCVRGEPTVGSAVSQKSRAIERDKKVICLNTAAGVGVRLGESRFANLEEKIVVYVCGCFL